MSFIHTIDLPTPLTFLEALAQLDAGKCLGIRPGKNTNYVVRFKPKWQRESVTRRFLCWNARGDDSPNWEIGVDQFLGEWFLVVIDHRDLPNGENGMVNLKKED